MNPCPCGHLGSVAQRCRCTPDQIARYQGRLSGPLLDRIDLHVEVPCIPTSDLLGAPAGESSAQIRARSLAARERALARQGKANQLLTPGEIDEHAFPDEPTVQFLRSAASRLGWSARGIHRTLKVARTIADLAGSERIELLHAAEALQYRQQVAHRVL